MEQHTVYGYGIVGVTITNDNILKQTICIYHNINVFHLENVYVQIDV